jgi:TonB family protein
MRYRWIPAIVIVLAPTLLPAQNPADDPAAAQAEVRPPELIVPPQDWHSQGHCGKKHFEWARLALDVMEDGSAQGVQFVDSSTPAVTEMAMSAEQNDRFTPAERDGKPVKMHGILLVEMHTCQGKEKKPDGTKSNGLWLEEPPKQSFWPWLRQPFTPRANAVSRMHNINRPVGRVSAPVPTFQPNAEFSDEARRNRVQGEVMITLIVDANGMPQDPNVVMPLPAGLSEAAIASVLKYRFRPALKDGTTPVPTMITIAVNFRLY